MEHGMHVFLLVDTVEHSTRDVANTFCNNPPDCGWGRPSLCRKRSGTPISAARGSRRAAGAGRPSAQSGRRVRWVCVYRA